MQDHAIFQTEEARVDLILAEIKNGKCRLNGPWVNPERENMHRFLYAIGMFPKQKVKAIADKLYTRHIYSDEFHQIRLIAVGNERNTDLPSDVVQLTWSDILAFVYGRFKGYSYHKADHPQWDSVGQYLYDEVKISGDLDKFLAHVSTRMGIALGQSNLVL